MIVDDHKLFADALWPALESAGMEVVGVATSASEALEAGRRERPDVALVDPALQDGGGVEVGRTMIAELQDTRVIALTALEDPGVVRECVRAGFVGFVTKDLPISRLDSAIRAAIEGSMAVPGGKGPSVARARDRRGGEDAMLAAHLTPREREVLALLAEGASAAEIQKRLSISRSTVRTHIHSILTKLQVRSGLQAAALAAGLGIVPRPRAEG